MNLRLTPAENNPPVELTEKNLKFVFKSGCRAAKYDDWAYYRNQYGTICNGLKAVDILCVKNQKLWLIEAKDYRQHRRLKKIEIADEICLKVIYSIAGIFAAGLNASDCEERSLAIAAKAATSIGVILHFEQPQKPSKLYPQVANIVNLKIKLSQKLKSIDAHPKVVDMDHMHGSLCWSVRENAP